MKFLSITNKSKETFETSCRLATEDNFYEIRKDYCIFCRIVVLYFQLARRYKAWGQISLLAFVFNKFTKSRGMFVVHTYLLLIHNNINSIGKYKYDIHCIHVT